MQVWDCETEKHLREMPPTPKDIAWSVPLNADGTLLAYATKDNWLRLWDVNAGAEIEAFDLAPLGAAIADVVLGPDGRHLATASGNGTVYVLRLSEARR